MMLRKRQNKLISEINVVPYIDVMLVLLVIFMITAPMLSQGIVVDLPQVASETVQTTEREPIVISVNVAGDYFLNIADTPTLPIDPQRLVLRVAAELALARQHHERLPILVKGDKGVIYGKVVEVMGLLKQAGAEQVGLLTVPPEGKTV